MDSKKLKMNTGRESGDSAEEDCNVNGDSYQRSKISNVLVFYVNGKEVRITIISIIRTRLKRHEYFTRLSNVKIIHIEFVNNLRCNVNLHNKC